jgi:hypothetical protein
MKLQLSVLCAVTLTLTSLAIAPASAAMAGHWSLQPRTDFFEVYIHACEPVEYDFGGVKLVLSPAAAVMHKDLFIKEYTSSCRDFYFEEIVPRTFPTEFELRAQGN